MTEPRPRQSEWPAFFRSKWAERLAVAGLMLTAALFRFPRLSRYSLNSDEISQVLWAKGPFFKALSSELFPPLFPILARPFLWFGREAGPRVVSVLAGILFCWLLWRITRKAFGPAVALLTLLFAALSPQLIALSRVGLPHMLFVTLSALAVLTYTDMREQPTFRNGARFALALAAAFYAFYYAAFLWLFFVAVSLLVLVENRAKAKRLLLACTAGLALFAPMILLFLLNTQPIVAIDRVYDWEAGPIQLLRRALHLFAGFSPAVGITLLTRLAPFRLFGSLVLHGLAALLILFGVFGLVRRNRHEPTTGWLVGFFFFCAGAAVAIHWIFRFPIQEHFLAFLAVAVLPLTAGACLWPRRRILSGVAVGLLVLSSVSAMHSHGLVFHQDLREAVRWIDMRARPGAMILTIDFDLADAYRIYGRKNIDSLGLPECLPGHPKMHRGQESKIRPRDREAFFTLLQNRPEVYLLTSNPKHGQENRGLGLVNQWMSEQGFELKGLESFAGGAISRYIYNNK